MDLVHPSKFIQSRKLPSNEVKLMLIEFMNLYPFPLDDIKSAENNLEVLHNNSEISLLLCKCAKERDYAVKKRKAKQRKIDACYQAEGTTDDEVIEEQSSNIEEYDEFEAGEFTGLDTKFVREGALCIQDLLTVAQETGLADALPQVMLLLEIAAVSPLTSVHCKGV